MSNLKSLLRVQFSSFLGLNKILHAPKSKKISGVGGLILTACLFALGIGYMGYLYTEIFAMVPSTTGNAYEVLILMLALSCIVSFFLSFYTVISLLYGNKDYEFLASTPIKTWEIVFSRIVYMYLQDLLFAVVIMIGSLIKYLSVAPALLFLDYLTLFLMILISPLLPTAVSILLGPLVFIISSRFKRKNTVQTILTLLILLGCFSLGFLEGLGVDFTKIIGKIYFILPLAISAFTEWEYLFLYAIVNALPFVLVFYFVIITYKKLNTLGKVRKKVKGFKLSTYGGRSTFRALLKKETGRLFSDVNYVMNNLLGPIFGTLGLIIFPIIVREIINIGYVEELLFIYPIIICFTFMLTPTTNCTISFEGQSFWILRTAPISMRFLLNVKLAVNALFHSIPALVAGVVSTIIFGAPYYVVLLIGGFGLAVSLLGGEVGLMMNLLFPHMNWKNSVEIVKRSVSVALTLLFAFVYTGLCFVFCYFVKAPIVLNILIVFIFTTLLAVTLYALIMKYGEKLIAFKM